MAILIITLVVTGFFLRKRSIWTDGQTINVAKSNANPRNILWTPPKPIGENLNTPGHEYEPALSPDGTELFFVRGLPGKNADIFVSFRRNNEWTKPQVLESINTKHDELGPRLTHDGKFLLFHSNRPGGQGGFDIWASTRTDTGWSQPVNAGAINSPFNEFGVAPSPDGQRLCFATNRTAGAKQPKGDAWSATIRENFFATDYDLWIADAVSAGDNQPTFENAREIEGVNTPNNEGAPCFTPAGDFLYFASNRSGGHGGFDLYRFRVFPDRIGDVENIGGDLNTAANETDPQLAMGGFRIFFSTDRDELVTFEDAVESTTPIYNLAWSESREVYLDEVERERPEMGNWWWILLVALLALLALLWFFRGLDSERLSMLHKCLLASMIMHLILLMLFSVAMLTLEVAEIIKEEAGMEIAVNLNVATELDMRQEARNQDTDVPVPEAPMVENAPTDTTIPQNFTPPPTFHNLPKTQVRPTNMTLPPAAPAVNTPKHVDQQSLPKPLVHNEAPSIQFNIESQLKKIASPNQPQPQQPQQNQEQQDNQPTDNATAQETQQDAPQATPDNKSLANAQEANTRTASATEKATIDSPETNAQAPNVAEFNSDQIAKSEANEPDAPNLKQPAEATQQFGSSETPQTAAKNVNVNAKPASASNETLAQPNETQKSRLSEAEVEKVRAQFSTTIDTTPKLAFANNEQRKVNPQADKSTDPNEPSSSPTVNRSKTSSPQAKPSDATVTVPASKPIENSLAVNATTNPRTPKVNDPVIIDMNTRVIDSPHITLPKIANRAKVDDAEPLAFPDEPKQTLEHSPLSVAKTEKPSELRDPMNEADLTESAKNSFARASLDDRPQAVKVSFDPRKLDIPLNAPVGTPEIGAFSSPEALAQRSFEQRKKMLKKMGGSKETEGAVARALAYLARHQQHDGRWTMMNDDRPKNRGRHKHDSAYTGLATLCYLAGDHTPHKPGPYTETVKVGLSYLLTIQKDNGDLRNGGDMYSHGIAALALAEAAVMTGDEKYRAAAHTAADFIVKAQHGGNGGWRYKPGEGGDTSVVGWQVMALHAAEMCGYEIPDKTRTGAYKWLDRVSNKKSGNVLAGYQSGHTPPMTAEAIFSRILLGQELTQKQIDFFRAYMLQNKPNNGPRNYYYFYYGTLAMHQFQGDQWKQWNQIMSNHLRKTQRKSGQGDGSWDHNGSKWGGGGGRIYSTAMGCLTLEVYYRYLPMHDFNRVKE